MTDIINAIVSYSFIGRALIVGLLIAVCAALLGVTLVLKRFSMIGDGLSHISFGSVALASVMGFAPLKVSIVVVSLCAVILLRFGGKKVKGDSMIAVISSAALAFGIAVISLTGSSADISSYLIGSIYATTAEDVVIASVLACFVIISFILLYTRIFSVTFDENFARATGMKADAYNTAIAVLTAITVVIGMRLMGALMISALIVFPALCAMRIFKSFFSVTLSSVIIGVFNFITGFVIALVFDDMPVGACITLVSFGIFIIISLVSFVKKGN